MRTERRGVIRATAFLSLLAALTGVAEAASLPRPVDAFTLQPGDTVRMWDAAGVRLAGRGGIVAADHSGVAVVVQGDAEIIPFASLQRMEVRRGRRHYERGAWIGAAAALVTYLLVTESKQADGDPYHALGWAVAGAAGGAAAGASVRGPRWHPVPLERFRAAPPPAAQLSLRLRF